MSKSFKEFLADGVTEIGKKVPGAYIKAKTKHVSAETTGAMDQFRRRLEIEKKLKQARADLKELNASPVSQDVADAVDDAKAEVADLEQKLAKAKADEGIKESTGDATASFKFRQDQAERLIHGIVGKLQELKVRQEAKPQDWGYAGSIGHVVELLEEIDTFLGSNQ